MEDKIPGFFDTALLWGGLAVTWLTGESGKVFIASGAGGLARWMSAEKKRIRDGILAVIGGAIAGGYTWPAVMTVMGIAGGGPIDHTPDNIAMAAFVAGTMGMSAVKILTALIEARAKKMAGGIDV